MSEHELRDDYDDESRDRPLAPEDALRWPASVLWAFAVLQFVATQVVTVLLVVLIVVVNFGDGDETLSSFWEHVRGEPGIWLIPVCWVLATVWTVLLIRAANDMRQFRGYRSVVLAVIMFMFSVPFVFLAVVQVPIGLAILTVLSQRDVRARFEAVARGRINAAPVETPDARRHRST